jgi:hypothetical protein
VKRMGPTATCSNNNCEPTGPDLWQYKFEIAALVLVALAVWLWWRRLNKTRLR